jgi:hypothetical protein
MFLKQTSNRQASVYSIAPDRLIFWLSGGRFYENLIYIRLQAATATDSGKNVILNYQTNKGTVRPDK